jgi:hypothetical protein
MCVCVAKEYETYFRPRKKAFRHPMNMKQTNYILPWLSVRRILLSAVTLLLALQITRDIRLSADSYHYIDISRTFATERVIATYHLTVDSTQIPDRNLLYPPIFPLLLALPQVMGCSPIGAARIVAVLCILLTCLAGARLCRLLGGRMLQAVCYGLILLIVDNMKVFRMVLSESLFMALPGLAWDFSLSGIEIESAEVKEYIALEAFPVAVAA